MTRTKSYFANTVEEALGLARQEFGDEALLLDSRKSRPGEEYLGAYEVVAGVQEAPATTGAVAGDEACEDAAPRRVSGEIAALRRELERMSGMLMHLASNMTALRRAELEPLMAELARAGTGPELIHQIMRRIPERPQTDGLAALAALRASVIEEIARRLVCEARLDRDAGEKQTVALVGPPGSGKTATLVKLAVKYGLEKRRAAAFITTDTYRIAAAAQLQAYAAILGVPCAVVEHGGALAHALEEFKSKDLVLIDTPGFSAGEWDLAADWSRCLLSRREIEIHLVLSATARWEDLERLLSAWRIFDPGFLIFTRMDETAAAGAALTAAIMSGLPVSFLGKGQSVPEDIAPASADEMLAFLAAPVVARSATA